MSLPPIYRRWAKRRHDAQKLTIEKLVPMSIEPYTLDTPNGRKISVAREEIGLTYMVHPVNIFTGEQFDPAFLKISPNPTDDPTFIQKTWQDLAARDLGSLSCPSTLNRLTISKQRFPV